MNAMIASFCLVFGKAYQQLNVAHSQYVSAAITSFGLAACEVTVLMLVIERGWPSVPWIGAGGAMGVTSAIYLHKRFRK